MFLTDEDSSSDERVEKEMYKVAFNREGHIQDFSGGGDEKIGNDLCSTKYSNKTLT